MLARSRRDIIMMLHQLVVVIVNGMVKFYPKEYVGATLFEAIKFCVPCLQVESCPLHRLPCSFFLALQSIVMLDPVVSVSVC